jgi:tetratricopeptide (TPR) repeat protein/O-antigen ligase
VKRGQVKLRLSPDFLRQPLVGPALLLGGVYILTTVLSIVPRLSLWGSYERLQGTYTTLSYLVIFFLVMQTLRTREQMERLITAILLTSWPIALFGLMQHYGLDPLPWGTDVRRRIISTIGNPIFLAAYLIMVIPLTARRFLQTLAGLHSQKQRRSSAYLLITCYALLLLAQILCLLFTQSRGPWLGFLGGLFSFLFLLALVGGRRRVALALMGLAVLVGLFLVVLNLPRTPLAPIKEMPYIGRLGRVLETETDTAKVRVLIWQAVVDLVQANSLRALVGYGPESMLVALIPHYPPALAHYEARAALPDRAHNETFDALGTTGVLGLGAYFLLFGSLFYYSLKGLKLIEGPRQRDVFVSLMLAGAILGGLLPRFLVGDWIFAGLGMALGLTMGLAFYLIFRLFSGPAPRLGLSSRRRIETIEGGRTIPLIALFSALVAHFIEINFGIAISSTRAYFWIYAALVGLLASRPLEAAAPRSTSGTLSSSEADEEGLTISIAWSPSVATYSLLVGLLLVTLGFDFVLLRGFPLRASNVSLLGLFAAVWVLSGLIIAAELEAQGEAGSDASAFLYPLFSLGWLALFLAFRALVLRPGGDGAQALILYYLWLFLSLFLLAVILPRRETAPTFWRGPIGCLYLPLLVGVAGLILVTNVNPIRADVYFKTAQTYAEAQRWDESLFFFQRALGLAPDQDVYYLHLGDVYLQRAQATAEPSQGEAWLQESLGMAERARELNPHHIDHAFNLAHLHLLWGQMAADPTRQTELWDKALEYYQQAAAISPTNVQVLNEWGFALQLRGAVDQALATYRRSLDLDPEYPQTYLLLGGLYRQGGKRGEAVRAYQQALTLDPNLVEAHIALGEVYLQEERLEEALQENLRAAQLAPENFALHQNLALLYQRLGQVDEALTEAREAWNYAPEERRPALEGFIQELEAQKR